MDIYTIYFFELFPPEMLAIIGLLFILFLLLAILMYKIGAA